MVMDPVTATHRCLTTLSSGASVIPAHIMKMLKPKRVVSLSKMRDIVRTEGNAMLVDRTGFLTQAEDAKTFTRDTVFPDDDFRSRYFGDDRDLLDIRVTIEGREQALFNPREVLHMRDVKALFGSVFRLHELALVYVVGYVAAVFLWARERSMRHLARLVALGRGHDRFVRTYDRAFVNAAHRAAICELQDDAATVEATGMGA